MIRLAFAAGIFACALALAALPLFAATQCAPRDGALATLAERYGEALTLQAMTTQGVLMEMTQNPATGSWSVLLTKADGVTCLILYGAGVEAFATLPPGEPG